MRNYTKSIFALSLLFDVSAPFPTVQEVYDRPEVRREIVAGLTFATDAMAQNKQPAELPGFNSGPNVLARVSGPKYSTMGGTEHPIIFTVMRTLNLILVIFNGTQDVSDGRTDLNFIKTELDIPTKGGGTNRLVCHRGFYDCTNTCYQAVCEKIAALKNQYYKTSGAQILFAGHSLGGAIADLMSIRYDSQFFGFAGGNDVICITLGQPKVYGDGMRTLPIAESRASRHIRLLTRVQKREALGITKAVVGKLLSEKMATAWEYKTDNVGGFVASTQDTTGARHLVPEIFLNLTEEQSKRIYSEKRILGLPVHWDWSMHAIQTYAIGMGIL